MQLAQVISLVGWPKLVYFASPSGGSRISVSITRQRIYSGTTTYIAVVAL